MNQRRVQWAGTLFLAIVAVWAGLRMHSGISPAPGSVRVPVGVASVPRPGDADSPGDSRTDTAASPVIPLTLPAFSLANLEGKSTPIATWHDRSLILNFWATWCAPCRHEIPLLQALMREWSGKGVEVVGIAVDHADNVTAFAHQLKIDYPLLVGEQDALDVAGSLGFAAPVFPFTVFTDRRGEVVTLYVGELHRPQAELILGVVQDLDQDRVALAEARRSIAVGLHELAPKSAG
jgi:thiol-disulfide isomerase/thioredoxin